MWVPAKRTSRSAVPTRAASLLQALLDAVERGELTAPGPMVAHLRGSLAALEALEKPRITASRRRLNT